MGFFTFTDAKFPSPDIYRSATGYKYKILVHYGKFAKVVCPDNTVYAEESYDGYGCFGGADVYELVVDWNKKTLVDDVKRCNEEEVAKFEGEPNAYILKENQFYLDIAAMLAEGKTDEDISRYIHRLAEDLVPGYMFDNWKRCLGIHISTGMRNRNLRYPIKITGLKRKVAYADLYPSMSAQ